MEDGEELRVPLGLPDIDFEPLPVAVAENERVNDGDRERVGREGEALTVPECEMVTVDGVGVSDPRVMVRVSVMASDCVGLRVIVTEGEGVADGGEQEGEAVPEEETVLLKEDVGEKESEGVGLRLLEGDRETVWELEGVPRLWEIVESVALKEAVRVVERVGSYLC